MRTLSLKDRVTAETLLLRKVYIIWCLSKHRDKVSCAKFESSQEARALLATDLARERKTTTFATSLG
jgi:hypothetical protein